MNINASKLKAFWYNNTKMHLITNGRVIATVMYVIISGMMFDAMVVNMLNFMMSFVEEWNWNICDPTNLLLSMSRVTGKNDWIVFDHHSSDERLTYLGFMEACVLKIDWVDFTCILVRAEWIFSVYTPGNKGICARSLLAYTYLCRLWGGRVLVSPLSFPSSCFPLFYVCVLPILFHSIPRLPWQ